MPNKTRCGWVNIENKLSIKYHDEEWGNQTHNDKILFEMLILEGAQAGLSWEIILKKRKNYQEAFDNFDPQKIAKYDDKKQNELLQNKGIVRNKLKIKSAIQNAKVFLKIQKEFDSFDKYIWGFVNNRPIKNKFKSLSDLPANTKLSDKISKDLKKQGMNFVGSTIIYAYMQSIGMVDDHIMSCFKNSE